MLTIECLGMTLIFEIITQKLIVLLELIEHAVELGDHITDLVQNVNMIAS